MTGAAAEIPVLNGPMSLWNMPVAGPVAAAYLRSGEPMPFIMGPMGSAKSTTSVTKCALTTFRFPLCKDGAIRAKGCVIRDNYRTLYRTTLPTWFNTFPRDFGVFEGGQDRPAKHTLVFRTPQGQVVEMIVDFYAIGDAAIEELLKGYEPSWAWVNEADLLHERVPDFLFSRLGRYPSRAHLADPAATMPEQVFGDLNPPSVDHWIYRDFEEDPKPGRRLFKQPSGLSDEAENRAGVPRARYEAMAKVMPEREVIRFVHGRFGYSNDGRPVYADFDTKKVFSDEELRVLPNVPLCAGLDQGLSPALELFQAAPDGQIRVLAEVVPPHGTGPARFSEMIVALLTSPRLRGLPAGSWFSDPAGFFGADRIAGELSWTETVGRAIGVQILPAPSQDLGLRIDALRLPLMTDLSPERKFLVVDPSCRMLRSGLAAQYQFARQRQNNRDVFADRPVKNEWSHPVEALQYGVLGLRGRAGIINEAARAGRPGNVVPIVTGRSAGADFNVWNV